jgi:heptosyltransferase-2
MKIVVRGANWIGDSVMSVPALRVLRQLFPNDEITLHTRAWAVGIFRDADFIDQIISYDRPESNLAEVTGQARRLRGEKFDVAVIFPNSFASALTARFAGIPRRFGFSKEGRKIVLTDAVPIPEWKSTRHEVYYYLALVEAVENSLLGTNRASGLELTTNLPVSEQRKDDARDFLSRKDIDVSRPIVALGPGSTNSMAKRWPLERFAKLADVLQREKRANIVLLGGPDDVEVAAKIAGMTESPVLDLAAKTSLGDAADILSVCDLMISNDMGLAHLAPAVGTPTLVIFGPTNPVTTRPFSDIAEVIRVDVECSPCMLRECPIDHRCMEWVTVEKVFEAAIAKLSSDDRNITNTAGGISRP